MLNCLLPLMSVRVTLLSNTVLIILSKIFLLVTEHKVEQTKWDYLSVFNVDVSYFSDVAVDKGRSGSDEVWLYAAG